MGHTSSKIWLESLNEPQKKFLLKKHGAWCQLSVSKFSTNERDRLMKLYENDSSFNLITTQLRVEPKYNTDGNDGRPTDWTFLD